MKKFRKIFGTAVSTLLLLIFSVTVVPIDLFHNHSQPPVCSTSSPEGSTCKHKLHIAKKSGFCPLCGIHQDKAFFPPAIAGVNYITSSATIYSWHVAQVFLSNISVHRLRGPPSNQVYIVS